MIKISAIVLITMVFSGCQSTPVYIEPKYTSSHSATIHIYRTQTLFHRFNPEKPFFYIDDKQFAKLGTGQSRSIRVSPGKHVITSKESIIFVPGYESGQIEIDTKSGENYYIRYSKEFGGVVGTSVVGNTRLSLSNKSDYSEKL